jgi:DNA-binding transcriptional regulator GbsR (MarR family)
VSIQRGEKSQQEGTDREGRHLTPTHPTPTHLTPGMLEFVESMGRYFEQYGLARIGGRILGLLVIAERPLSLDEIASRLRVSRASVSTNIRLATASDLAELVTYAGDRRDYYRMIDDAWGHALEAEIKGLPALRRIAETGLAALNSVDTPARTQLEETIDFCDFMMEERTRQLAAWQERRAARRRAAGRS